MQLSCAIRILCDPVLYKSNNKCAQDLLNSFVLQFPELYGTDSVRYCVHSLVHLPADTKLYGNLDSYSAFKFENYLHKLKSVIQPGPRPLEQLANRLAEDREP